MDYGKERLSALGEWRRMEGTKLIDRMSNEDVLIREKENRTLAYTVRKRKRK